MKPLIVAATPFEISPSIPLLEELDIPCLITGVGMTATAYALGKALALAPTYAEVINVGIAGSFSRELPLGSVVSISQDTFYELGAEDGNNVLSIEELGLGKGTYFTSSRKAVDLPKYAAITVNRVHGNEASIALCQAKYPHVALESMEGAAIFYACAQEELPCIQVRAISNYVERRDKSSWKIDLAITNLNNWLQKFIRENY